MEDTTAPGASKRILLNLGSGPVVTRTRWQDCDGSWNVLASQLPLGLGWAARKIIGHAGNPFPSHVRYVNITKRLPFGDKTVDAVYFSHVLEHLYLDEGRHLLAESHRILKPGGLVRILVPDTEHYINSYLASRATGASSACFELNQNLMFREMESKVGILRKLYTSLTDFHSHKFMYDRSYLAECLATAGFSEIQEAAFLQSRIPEIAEVELPGRVGAGLGFGFEAKRPQLDA
jgi:SAM-dependent methyltransferase